MTPTMVQHQGGLRQHISQGLRRRIDRRAGFSYDTVGSVSERWTNRLQWLLSAALNVDARQAAAASEQQEMDALQTALFDGPMQLTESAVPGVLDDRQVDNDTAVE
jgi:hypothetical protein